MTIGTSVVSMSAILAELQLVTPGRTTPISLNDADVRQLIDNPVGGIQMVSYRSATSIFFYSFTVNSANVNLRSAMVTAGSTP